MPLSVAFIGSKFLEMLFFLWENKIVVRTDFTVRYIWVSSEF